MELIRLNYYLDRDREILAKGIGFQNWIYDFEKRKWVYDRKSIINDMLMGYDPGEPEGSPYGIGSTSVMDELEHITYETAMEMIGDISVQRLIEIWKKRYEGAEAKKGKKKPEGFARAENMMFCLYGTMYVLYAEDFGLKPLWYEEEFLASLKKEVAKDLKKIGAEEIRSFEQP